MRLRADPDQRHVIDTHTLDWLASPAHGVNRRMLDRVGEEVAVATSIVEYLPGCGFHAHTHGAGEEILVLRGRFSDEHGDYPAGTYLRNPPGTSHTPRPEAGCTIFVKLRQFQAGDDQTVRVDTRNAGWRLDGVPERLWLPLHEHGGIATQMLRWGPGITAEARDFPGGEEVLVLDGSWHDEHGDYPAGTWLRNPPGHVATRRAGPAGVLAYQKTGHVGARFMDDSVKAP
ncbi:MAG: hypothetical protein RL026_2046 [Pseudomonadota bacterium]|jgi:anti-sigma factor ChrR (cupin superfamily)